MQKFFSLVKIAHTVFALPFSLLGYAFGVQASGEGFNIKILILVVICMFLGRNAAMAFNRLVDQKYDLLNPRTQKRELPAGLLSRKAVITFILINCILFILTTYFINWMCFYLSPIAILVILGYSYTKRFTSLSHFILGLGLSLAPIGAYMAVTEQISLISFLYATIVLLWVAGFDVIYSLQDIDIDQKEGLYSLPSWLGKKSALKTSLAIHFICAAILVYTLYYQFFTFDSLGWLHITGGAFFIILLFYQHSLVKHDDLSKLNIAFFTTNGIASIVFCFLVILDLYV